MTSSQRSKMAPSLPAFRSACCRLWSGPRGASVSAIEGASDSFVQTLPFSVEVRISRSKTGRAMSMEVVDNVDSDAGILLSRTPMTAPEASNRDLLLAEARMSWFSLYSASPLSLSVMIVLELDADSGQQCYFFGHLSRLPPPTTAPLQPTSSSDCAISHQLDDGEAAEQLLLELHRAFPDVALTPLAREAVGRQQHLQAANGIKRLRQSLNPSAFYGQVAAQSPVTTPPTAANRTDASAGWSALYHRLQFRVSRSLMCQLEGTAPVSATFPRQQEAFEFADQVVAFRRELEVRKRDRKEVRTKEPGSVTHPRAFSFESAHEGKRRFLVASLDEFWRTYEATEAGQRHVYEIIRESVPCRLYFDLEFKRELNTDVDGDLLVERLVLLLQLQLYRKFGLRVSAARHIVQLDSSTAAKFSRHLIFHMPNGELFADNLHAGAFVREFISDLVDPRPTEDSPDPDALCHPPPSPFLVRNTDHEGRDQRQLFIDTGVYTRNRMFRVLGSSKYRKTATLRLHPGGDDRCDFSAFLSTLVCPFPSLEAMRLESPSTRLLRCSQGGATSRRPSLFISTRVSSSRPVECRQSSLPQLDAFIRSQATRGGVQGEIRAVQMLFPPSPPPNSDGRVEKMKPTPWMVTFHMSRNRWCGNVGRAHRSNNVMFVVDLSLRVYYQKCHDPACQATDYRSLPQPLPPHVLLDLDSAEPTQLAK